MSKKTKQISDAEKHIKEALATKGPFSHNIISMALGDIAKSEGKEAANKMIDKYKLQKLGWNKE